MSKNEIRNHIRQQRRNQSPSIIQRKSKAIWESLSSIQEFNRAGTIAFYVSIAREGEVDTTTMIEESLSLGKRICVPKVVKNNALRFIEIRSMKDLNKGSFGILEPAGGSRILPQAIDLVIVPGVAFDKSGNRLGFGKGYYDKFLSKLEDGTPIIALAFDFQIVDGIPSSKNDVKVHKIITETSIIECLKHKEP
ncbi:MAG: 5-formyltetrahydrofolate cyclo-ligase [Thaumarchaeota archaeon]|nr:5-formyltetrahydrofolate cyclo-ligase [Nitrososphaerota archaeon]